MQLFAYVQNADLGSIARYGVLPSPIPVSLTRSRAAILLTDNMDQPARPLHPPSLDGSNVRRADMVGPLPSWLAGPGEVRLRVDPSVLDVEPRRWARFAESVGIRRQWRARLERLISTPGDASSWWVVQAPIPPEAITDVSDLRTGEIMSAWAPATVPGLDGDIVCATTRDGETRVIRGTTLLEYGVARKIPVTAKLGFVQVATMAELEGLEARAAAQARIGQWRPSSDALRYLD